MTSLNQSINDVKTQVKVLKSSQPNTAASNELQLQQVRIVYQLYSVSLSSARVHTKVCARNKKLRLRAYVTAKR